MLIHRLQARALLASFALLAVACSPSDPTPPALETPDAAAPPDGAGPEPDAGPVMPDPATMDACVRFRQHLMSLGCSPKVSDEARIRASCAAWLTLPGTRLSPAAFDTCLQTYPDECLEEDGVPSCSFRGELAVGETCSDHTQCKTGRCTYKGNINEPHSGPCGVCAPVIESGETCSVGGLRCAPGLNCGAYCEKGGPNAGTCHGGVCGVPTFKCNSNGDGCRFEEMCAGPVEGCVPVPVAASGGRCGAHVATCAPSFGCKDYACRPAGVGAACHHDEECSSELVCEANVCGPGLREGDKGCSSAGRMCGKHLECLADTCVSGRYAQPGESCAVKYCALGECPQAPAARVCPPTIPDGDACSYRDMSRVCTPPASCEDGTCQIVWAACAL
jgi:hypothetical protein